MFGIHFRREPTKPIDPGPAPDPYKIDIFPRFEASFALECWIWTISECYLHTDSRGAAYRYASIGSGIEATKDEAKEAAKAALKRICEKRKLQKEALTYTVKDPCHD